MIIIRNILCLLIPFSLSISSCKTSAYFSTPNDVHKSNAIVYILNGIEKKGSITIRLEGNYQSAKFIQLENGKDVEQLLIDSIKFYNVNENYYFPKLIEIDFKGTQHLLFVKRLTGEISRIHLYELQQQKSQTSDGQDYYNYYISLPTYGRLNVLSIARKELTPNFHEKMSKIVKDCASLSNKIQEKNKGYFLAEYTRLNTKKIEVFKRIIDEYNNCH